MNRCDHQGKEVHSVDSLKQRRLEDCFHCFPMAAQLAKHCESVHSCFPSSYIHFATSPNGQVAVILARTNLAGFRGRNGV